MTRYDLRHFMLGKVFLYNWHEKATGTGKNL
jgi:hypothetical protein